MTTATPARTTRARGTDKRARAATAALMLLAAVLFGTGATIERAVETHDDVASQSEAAEHREGEEAEEAERSEESEAAHVEPTFLGVNLESPALVALGVLLSIAAAVAIIRSDALPVLAAVTLFSAVFAALDINEAFRQGAADPGLLTVAALAGIAHAIAALIALRMLAARC